MRDKNDRAREKLSFDENMSCNKVKADEEGIYMINSEHMTDSHAVSENSSSIKS